MGKLIITEFVSLDGVMEAPGGEENFKYSGWTFDYDQGKDGQDFKMTETREAEALLLGRVTYEGFAAAWPKMEGEFADIFNAMPKYVVSHTLGSADWNNSKILSGDPIKQVKDLKCQLGGNLVVHGSRTLAQALIHEDLVDELHLMLFPVVLGAGRRLFGETSDRKRFKLVSATTVGDGLVILVYTAARA